MAAETQHKRLRKELQKSRGRLLTLLAPGLSCRLSLSDWEESLVKPFKVNAICFHSIAWLWILAKCCWSCTCVKHNLGKLLQNKGRMSSVFLVLAWHGFRANSESSLHKARHYRCKTSKNLYHQMFFGFASLHESYLAEVEWADISLHDFPCDSINPLWSKSISWNGWYFFIILFCFKVGIIVCHAENFCHKYESFQWKEEIMERCFRVYCLVLW